MNNIYLLSYNLRKNTLYSHETYYQGYKNEPLLSESLALPVPEWWCRIFTVLLKQLSNIPSLLIINNNKNNNNKAEKSAIKATIFYQKAKYTTQIYLAATISKAKRSKLELG